MQFRNGTPTDPGKSISQSINPHSGHFHLSCESGLVFLSFRISCHIPGLFKNMSPLGNTELLPTEWHAGTSKVTQERATTEKPASSASHLKELQIDLIGHSFCFHTDYLFPNLGEEQIRMAA